MMNDLLSMQIGYTDATNAQDFDLAQVLNECLNVLDANRRSPQLGIEERLELTESALLALATVVSRRLEL